jgi:cell division protein FtsB
VALRAPRAADPERFDRRQKRLLVVAWAATLLPLLAFAYLTWQSVELKGQVDSAKASVAEARTELEKLDKTRTQLKAEIAQLTGELDTQRSVTKHYRDFAGIRIRFYRESDRAVVEQALVNLGFRIDSTLGQSKLINLQPNTIAYGRDVAPEDLRDIAVALVQAGFPLKRIAPAQTQPDPKLIQIYASVETDQKCGLLKLDEIRAGRQCGTRQS